MKPFYIIESGEVPQATAEVVESAQSRYVAVEHARMSSLSPFLEGFHSFPLDSALRYTPLDIINLLHNIDNRLTDMRHAQEEIQDTQGDIQKTLDEMKDAQKSSAAHLANLRILNQNSHLKNPLPLQKTVSYQIGTLFRPVSCPRRYQVLAVLSPWCSYPTMLLF